MFEKKAPGKKMGESNQNDYTCITVYLVVECITQLFFCWLIIPVYVLYYKTDNSDKMLLMFQFFDTL